ncbi:hypothetical protein [Bordetella bronchialis]|uniref:Uncharacterized protein n=1 Tax=Bordetella bronchialis TaxID=463025 RepID=A0A193G2R7_9BORD|nr:hypothetical protein [Bordetella bronchialis]ANN68829.1 hypothetical protein BAU06_23255 [Bordetella bronchialis]ANN73973.1 hypothetical protein BAU08_23810 [Bordetella bronchialis]
MKQFFIFAICGAVVFTALARNGRRWLWCPAILTWALLCQQALACTGELVAAAWSAVSGV